MDLVRFFVTESTGVVELDGCADGGVDKSVVEDAKASKVTVVDISRDGGKDSVVVVSVTGFIVDNGVLISTDEEAVSDDTEGIVVVAVVIRSGVIIESGFKRILSPACGVTLGVTDVARVETNVESFNLASMVSARDKPKL